MHSPHPQSNNNIGNVFVVSPDGTKMASILVSKSQGTSIVYVWDLMSWNCVAMLKVRESSCPAAAAVCCQSACPAVLPALQLPHFKVRICER